MPLCRSPRIATLQQHMSNEVLYTEHMNTPLPNFLSHFASVCDTHYLIPVSVSPDSPSQLIPQVLAAITNGNTEISINDNDDDLSWASALASPSCEYWIAGAQDELKSLADLKVFVLIPHSDLPPGQ